MTRKLFLPLALTLLGVLLPVCAVAQSDSGEPSLGDLARQFRKGKAALEHAVIDNDNLHQVMDEVQTRKLDGKLLFSIDGSGKKFQVSSPDVTCDLSFSASATSLLSDPTRRRTCRWANWQNSMARPRSAETRYRFRAQRHHLEHKGNYGGVTILRGSEATRPGEVQPD